ncbi:matrixin family metalloprotease [Bacillus mycoides]|uniref:matrixin family metalloprotease n=1 Tax=Bacillus mycoides TaxID=1405 RepID=UPI000BF0EBCB|nr:matrixin family metalloprotease [Bacillus mycoides]PEK85150.1 peptidase [Bacillus mycoides]
MNFRKGITAFLLGSVFVFSSVGVSEAYVKEGWKLPSKSATYKWGDRLDDGSSIIKSGWQAADSSWYTASRINFTVSSSSVNKLNSWFESSSTYYGRMNTTYNTSTKKVTKFAGDINAGNTNITKSNVAKSTGVHEFGHAIGIGHNSGTSIMNSNRNRTTMHVPQTDDKNGVNAIY